LSQDNLDSLFTVTRTLHDLAKIIKESVFNSKEWPLIGDLKMTGMITECKESYLMHIKDSNTSMTIILPALLEDMLQALLFLEYYYLKPFTEQGDLPIPKYLGMIHYPSYGRSLTVLEGLEDFVSLHTLINSNTFTDLSQ
jgi:hypothetical protein